MDSPLLVRAIINSSVEAVLNFKCVNLMDMNLEVQVMNAGREVVGVRSEIELSTDSERERVDYLYPHGVHLLGPDQTMSFYLSYDERRFSRFTRIAVFDDQGHLHFATISGDQLMPCKKIIVQSHA